MRKSHTSEIRAAHPDELSEPPPPPPPSPWPPCITCSKFQDIFVGREKRTKIGVIIVCSLHMWRQSGVIVRFTFWFTISGSKKSEATGKKATQYREKSDSIHALAVSESNPCRRQGSRKCGSTGAALLGNGRPNWRNDANWGKKRRKIRKEKRDEKRKEATGFCSF